MSRPAVHRLPLESPVWTVLALVGLSLAGCAGPTYVAPTVEKPKGPLSLEEAVNLAIRNNPDVTAAGQRVEQARSSIDEAASDIWPVLRFSESFFMTDTPSQAFGFVLDQKRFNPTMDFNDPGVKSNWHTGLTGSITLFDGGRRMARWKAKAAEASSAEARLDQVRRDLALEVARGFYTIHKARETAAAQEKSIKTLETHLRITQARHSEGAARKSDVLGVQVRLAETREALIVARNSALRAESGLRVLLGLDMGEPLELEPASGLEAFEREGLSALLDRARANRPELVQALHDLLAARERVREAMAGYFPEITLVGGFGFDDGHAFDFQYGNLMWGVTFMQSVVEMFRTPYRVRQAMAQLGVADAAARKALLDVELDVKNSLLDAEEAEARHDVAEQAVQLAEETLGLVEAEYREGTAAITRLLEAELSLTQARTRLSAMTYDRALSRIAILHSAGEFPAPPRRGPAPPEPSNRKEESA